MLVSPPSSRRIKEHHSAHLARESDVTDDLIGLQVEDHDLRRAYRHKIIDRRYDTGVDDPQPIASIQPGPVHGDQLGAIDVALPGAMPIPRGIRLQLRTAALRHLPGEEAQGGGHAGAQPGRTNEDSVPGHLDAGHHHVLGSILIAKAAVVR